MKFTTTTILAALATLSSAAAVPSTLQPLPDKFTLVFTTKDSALSKVSPNITIDRAFGGTSPAISVVFYYSTLTLFPS